MPKIKIKNSEELKKTKKPIKIIGKILTGVAIAGVASTLIGAGGMIVFAQTAHHKARNEAKESGRPQEIALLKGDDRIDGISEYFEEAIRGNEKLSPVVKGTIIEGFTENVIEKYGMFFTEDTIANMYAVASTEEYREMWDFEKEHSWWDGDMNTVFNEISVFSYNDEAIAAHEQLHASLKGDLKTSGYANGLFGYGINEGMTGWMSDGAYHELGEY